MERRRGKDERRESRGQRGVLCLNSQFGDPRPSRASYEEEEGMLGERTVGGVK